MRFRLSRLTCTFANGTAKGCGNDARCIGRDGGKGGGACNTGVCVGVCEICIGGYCDNSSGGGALSLEASTSVAVELEGGNDLSEAAL